MMPPLYPLRFTPIFKPVLWGGYRIAPYKGILSESRTIGESWELSPMPNMLSIVAEGSWAGTSLQELMHKRGEQILGSELYAQYGTQFPLLIKFIDAREDLSIQVHPTQEVALSKGFPSGKSEMWYIVDCTQGASLCAGFKPGITPEVYQKAVADSNVTALLQYDTIAQGDLFYIPAGRIHTIGAGSFILEVQQALDVTYRIWDFNRRDAQGELRPLHLQEAAETLDFRTEPSYRLPYEQRGNSINKLLSTAYFTFSTLPLTEPLLYAPSSGKQECVVLVALKGSATLTDCNGYAVEILRGQTLLIPACCLPLQIVPHCQALIAAITLAPKRS